MTRNKWLLKLFGHIRLRVNERMTRVLIRNSMNAVRSRTRILFLLDIKNYEWAFRIRVKRVQARSKERNFRSTREKDYRVNRRMNHKKGLKPLCCKTFRLFFFIRMRFLLDIMQLKDAYIYND